MVEKKGEKSARPSLLGKLICKHDWVKRENWYQPDRATGKVAYKCSLCGKIANKPALRSP